MNKLKILWLFFLYMPWITERFFLLIFYFKVGTFLKYFPLHFREIKYDISDGLVLMYETYVKLYCVVIFVTVISFLIGFVGLIMCFFNFKEKKHDILFICLNLTIITLLSIWFLHVSPLTEWVF